MACSTKTVNPLSSPLEVLNCALKDLPTNDGLNSLPQAKSPLSHDFFFSVDVGGTANFFYSDTIFSLNPASLVMLSPKTYGDFSNGIGNSVQAGYRLSSSKERIQFDFGLGYHFTRTFDGPTLDKVTQEGAKLYDSKANATQYSFFPLEVGAAYINHVSLGLRFYLLGFTQTIIKQELFPESLNKIFLSSGAEVSIGYPFTLDKGRLLLSPYAKAKILYSSGQFNSPEIGFISVIYSLGVEVSTRTAKHHAPPPSLPARPFSETYLELENQKIEISRIFDSLVKEGDELLRQLIQTEEKPGLNQMMGRYADLQRRVAEAYAKMFEWIAHIKEDMQYYKDFKPPTSGSLIKKEQSLREQVNKLAQAAAQSFGIPVPLFSPDLSDAYILPDGKVDRTLVVLSFHLKAEEAIREFYSAYLHYLKVQSSHRQIENIDKAAKEYEVVQEALRMAEILVKLCNSAAEEYLKDAKLLNLQPIDFRVKYYNPFGSNQ